MFRLKLRPYLTNCTFKIMSFCVNTFSLCVDQRRDEYWSCSFPFSLLELVFSTRNNSNANKQTWKELVFPLNHRSAVQNHKRGHKSNPAFGWGEWNGNEVSLNISSSLVVNGQIIIIVFQVRGKWFIPLSGYEEEK